MSCSFSVLVSNDEKTKDESTENEMRHIIWPNNKYIPNNKTNKNEYDDEKTAVKINRTKNVRLNELVRPTSIRIRRRCSEEFWLPANLGAEMLGINSINRNSLDRNGFGNVNDESSLR